MSFYIARGDLEPAMIIDCLVNGEAEDISDATALHLHWLKPDGNTVIVTLTAVSLVGGTVVYQWVSGDTDIVGAHYGQVVILRGSGNEQTFPSDGSRLLWWVTPRL